MHWGPESIPPNAPYALSRGFVVYGSDSGHQAAGGRGAPAAAPAADWTTNDEAFTNFAYAQMKKTHDVAVALVARFYGESIRRSYYLGSSQGGREALIVAQRFPQDYDGVFAQVPANTYVHLSIGEPLARAKAQAGDGWIPPAKVAVIGKEVLRQCDALDGIADGLVSNYMACDRRFDPAANAEPAGGGPLRRRSRYRRVVPLGCADPRGKRRARFDVLSVRARERLDDVLRLAHRQRVGRRTGRRCPPARPPPATSACCAAASSAIRTRTCSTSTSRNTRKSCSSCRS